MTGSGRGRGTDTGAGGSGEPGRWLAGASDAPPGVVELLRAGRPAAAPPPEVRARLGHELATMSALAPARGPWWTFGAGALVAALGVGAWFGVAQLRTPEPPPGIATPQPSLVPKITSVPTSPTPPLAPPAAPVLAPPAPPPALPVSRASSSSRHPARPAGAAARASAPRGPGLASSTAAAPSDTLPAPSPVDPLAREAALVEEARGVVRARPAAALAVLDRHRREFPSGQLAAEREFLTIHALVQLGRGDEAEARGRRLVQQYPGSAYAQQVPALLARARR